VIPGDPLRLRPVRDWKADADGQAAAALARDALRALHLEPTVRSDNESRLMTGS
jgi:hypothetical protein